MSFKVIQKVSKQKMILSIVAALSLFASKQLLANGVMPFESPGFAKLGLEQVCSMGNCSQLTPYSDRTPYGSSMRSISQVMNHFNGPVSNPIERRYQATVTQSNRVASNSWTQLSAPVVGQSKLPEFPSFDFEFINQNLRHKQVPWGGSSQFNGNTQPFGMRAWI